MVGTLDDRRVLELVQRYFNALKEVGYVPADTTFNYMLYLFLYDFVDVLYELFGEEDYDQVNRLLISIFSDGSCLMPYESYGNCRVKVGNNRYNGEMIRRITEGFGSRDRIAEDGRQRGAVL